MMQVSCVCNAMPSAVNSSTAARRTLMSRCCRKAGASAAAFIKPTTLGAKHSVASSSAPLKAVLAWRGVGCSYPVRGAAGAGRKAVLQVRDHLSLFSARPLAAFYALYDLHSCMLHVLQQRLCSFHYRMPWEWYVKGKWLHWSAPPAGARGA